MADDIVEQLVPLVAAGGGAFGSLRFEIDLDIGGAEYLLEHRDQEVARCTLCWDPRSHDAWWRSVLEYLAINPASALVRAIVEPATPWLVTEPLTGADDSLPGEIRSLSHAERCIAWAIMHTR